MKMRMDEERRKAFKAFDGSLLLIPKDDQAVDRDELRRAHEAFGGDALRIDPEPESVSMVQIRVDISVSVSHVPIHDAES